ncbi:hypothetical protein F0562_010272 [Nyssa sinensis]|uniref:Uncharacterized protein n=1 Tax=Nyssa sinensis TaxID=561372 RepID=A0A5J5A0M5_9ASTE|nr:hypothetical protein F0562_010272 [Nyssa sinensis]
MAFRSHHISSLVLNSINNGSSFKISKNGEKNIREASSLLELFIVLNSFKELSIFEFSSFKFVRRTDFSV